VFTDRVNVFGLIFFLLAWHIAVYCPVAHVLWNPQGFLLKHDVQDFAGETCALALFVNVVMSLS
jgi:Amt family ammonium transporter